MKTTTIAQGPVPANQQAHTQRPTVDGMHRDCRATINDLTWQRLQEDEPVGADSEDVAHEPKVQLVQGGEVPV